MIPEAWTGRLHAPRTLLVRVLLLFVSVLIVSFGTWIALFRIAEQEPRAIQAARMVGSVANLTHAALLHAAPEQRFDLLRELSETEGIRLRPTDPADKVTDLPDDAYHRLFAAETRRLLGNDTRLAYAIDDEPGLWASFWIDDQDEYWIVIPAERLTAGVAMHWLGWALLAATLALLAAWLVARRVTIPLRALATAARRIGQGYRPPPLAAEGGDEMAEVATAFNHMMTDLSQMERERAVVLAGISHDLRTPIARLRLEAEMSVADASARDAMVADLEQMDKIIGQFLAYARGEEDEAFVDDDLAPLLSECADRFAAQGVEIRCVADGTLPVRMRPTSLRRAIDNLVENARKYAASPIEISGTHENGDCVVRVCDRGPGIPEAEHARMLRPFSRLESARSNANGTGLGLAIVDRIVRAHQGKLNLATRDGGGLCVEIRMPRQLLPVSSTSSVARSTAARGQSAE